MSIDVVWFLIIFYEVGEIYRYLVSVFRVFGVFSNIEGEKSFNCIFFFFCFIGIVRLVK